MISKMNKFKLGYGGVIQILSLKFIRQFWELQRFLHRLQGITALRHEKDGYNLRCILRIIGKL